MGYRMTSKCLLLSVLCAMLAATTLYYTTLQLTIINATLCIAAMCSSSVAVIMLHIACSSPADSHTMSSLMAQYLMYSVCKVGGWYVYMVLVRRSNTMGQSQEQMLKSILVKNKDTQYGVNHGFSLITGGAAAPGSAVGYAQGGTNGRHYGTHNIPRPGVATQQTQNVFGDVSIVGVDSKIDSSRVSGTLNQKGVIRNSLGVTSVKTDRLSNKAGGATSTVGGAVGMVGGALGGTLGTIQEDVHNTRRTRGKEGAANAARGLGSRVSLRDVYKDRVPLSDYSDYVPYIDRIENGADKVLTHDPVLYLATTSGTTGRRKLIPITRTMKQDVGKRMMMLMMYIMHKTMPLKLGKTLLLSYMPTIHRSSCGLEIGPVSYHMGKARHLPFTTSPQAVQRIDNEQTALYIHSVFGLAEPEVSFIDGIFSTLVFSMWKMIEDNWEAICNTIQTGELPSSLQMKPEILAEIRNHLVPNPKRASHLRDLFSFGMKNIARRIWPGIRCVRMLTSGAFAHQARIIEQIYMCDVTVISQLHVSSEGFMGLNTQRLSVAGVEPRYTAVPLYGVLEYIHEDDMDLASPDTVYVEELAVGESYEVVMTTPMGLYRYRTGDVLTVVSHYNHLPIYVFKQRRGQMLNLFWEKVTEEMLYKSVIRAAQYLGVEVVGFTATESIHMPTGSIDPHLLKHYVVFVEIQTTPDGMIMLNADEVAQLDVELRHQVELYDDLRRVQSIGEMQVIQLQPGALQKLKNFAIRSTQNQQYKFTYITRNSPHLHFLLQHQIGIL